jgi:hypothetical protein
MMLENVLFFGPKTRMEVKAPAEAAMTALNSAEH